MTIERYKEYELTFFSCDIDSIAKIERLLCMKGSDVRMVITRIDGAGYRAEFRFGSRSDGININVLSDKPVMKYSESESNWDEKDEKCPGPETADDS